MVLDFTGQAGELVRRSIREARALADQARHRDAGAAVERLEAQVELAEKVCRQITQRLAGEKITDRLVSLADPDARPIGKGKLGKRYEFGDVFRLTELTANTRRGARGLILPVCQPDRLAERKRAAAGDRGRAGPARDQAARSGARRRLPRRGRQPALPGRPRVGGRPTTPAVEALQEAPRQPSRRQRRPHQPPQTGLRPAPIAAERPHRRPNLDPAGRS
jgi:hypothetical protein